jgi:hypothetical protein
VEWNLAVRVAQDDNHGTGWLDLVRAPPPARLGRTVYGLYTETVGPDTCLSDADVGTLRRSAQDRVTVAHRGPENIVVGTAHGMVSHTIAAD